MYQIPKTTKVHNQYKWIKYEYRIVSNCGPLSNCAPPLFFNQEIYYDVPKLDIFPFLKQQFYQLDIEHVVLQCYLLFSLW